MLMSSSEAGAALSMPEEKHVLINVVLVVLAVFLALPWRIRPHEVAPDSSVADAEGGLRAVIYQYNHLSS
jgi:hypothetical protein